MMNLDMRQKGVEKAYKEVFNMPVYYITELLAIACGDSPSSVGTNRHFVEAVNYIENLPDEPEPEKSPVKPAAPKEVPAKAAAMTAEPKDTAAQSEPAEKVPVSAASGVDEGDAIQKKVDAFIKAFSKNPDKMAAKLIEDPERAGVLAEIITGDEKKIAKLAELMVTDKDKAAKAAEAFVTGELKKRNK